MSRPNCPSAGVWGSLPIYRTMSATANWQSTIVRRERCTGSPSMFSSMKIDRKVKSCTARKYFEMFRTSVSFMSCIVRMVEYICVSWNRIFARIRRNIGAKPQNKKTFRTTEYVERIVFTKSFSHLFMIVQRSTFWLMFRYTHARAVFRQRWDGKTINYKTFLTPVV